MFNAALRSGQLNAVLQSFGLPPSRGEGGVNSIEEFLNAIQTSAQKERGEEEKGDEDKMDTS